MQSRNYRDSYLLWQQQQRSAYKILEHEINSMETDPSQGHCWHGLDQLQHEHPHIVVLTMEHSLHPYSDYHHCQVCYPATI